jgi:undecaprenyl-diphosphatase
MNIINWDIALFKFINTTMSNPLFDSILPWMREPMFWVPLYVFIGGFVFFNAGLKAWWFVVFLTLTASTSDIISSRIIKQTIKRLRPCRTEYVEVIERVHCGSGYSFTSSHAANHFAVACFIVLTLGQEFRKIKKWCWIWASLISFSQIYVGVHFPLDIIGGTMLGLLVGQCWAIVFNKYYGHVLNEIKV